MSASNPVGRTSMGPTAALPHWASKHEEETRWAPFGAVVLAVGLQLALPERLSLGPGWLLPTVEGGLAVGLLIANPFRAGRDSPAIQRVSLLLVAVMSIANGASAALLIRGLLQGHLAGGATALLANGSGGLHHQRNRVRALVLGVGPRRPDSPSGRRPSPS